MERIINLIIKFMFWLLFLGMIFFMDHMIDDVIVNIVDQILYQSMIIVL